MPSITVCKNCEDRVLGCHSTCEKYLNEKKETENQKTVYKFKQRLERELDEVVRDAKRRW